jgi:hypothetical protein
MADNRGPIRRYLRWWGQALRGRVRISAYEAIDDPAALPDDTYIFGDGERLPPAGRARVDTIRAALVSRGPRVRVLNDPRHQLRRRELLAALCARGTNRFKAYGIDAPREPMRFPVFVRHVREHTGALSPLLENATALEAAIAQLMATGHDATDLLIVEYLDTSVDGVFRKYAVLKIGPALLAHHIFFGTEWMVKGSERPSANRVAEDEAFIAANPHAAAVAPIFDLAGIDFGRIDYSLLDGQIQVWEINTVPTILMHPSYYRPHRIAAKRAFTARINVALAALDSGAAPPGLVQRLASYRDLFR